MHQEMCDHDEMDDDATNICKALPPQRRRRALVASVGSGVVLDIKVYHRARPRVRPVHQTLSIVTQQRKSAVATQNMYILT